MEQSSFAEVSTSLTKNKSGRFFITNTPLTLSGWEGFLLNYPQIIWVFR
jgi:hypothetical protein